MSYLGKTYSFEKEENLEAFVDSLGLPEDKKAVVLSYKPSHSLRKEGDEYIQSTSDLSGAVKELRFKNGVEFDEDIAPGIVAKTKFTIEGNVVVQNQSFPDGLAVVYKKVYSADGFVADITTNKWDGVARRYYKAD